MASSMICFLILISLSVHASCENECIWTIQKEFQMNHPFIIKNQTFENVNILKRLSGYGQFSNVGMEIKEIPSWMWNLKLNVIYFVNTNENITNALEPFINKPHINLMMILILQDYQFLELYKHLELEINEKVFLFKESTQEVFETYSINNQNIQRKLGHIDSQTNTFLWSVDSSLYKRRSNFHGKVFKGMTEFSGTNMNANPKYVKNAPYFSNNQTFLVNGYTYGLFNDILKILEAKLNFSTLLYKHKTTAWGYIYPQPNGSYIGTGMAGDLFFNKAEIIVAPFGISLKRALYIDFLPPVQTYFAGLYTPSLDAAESVDLRLFFSPFTINVWIVIGIISFSTATLKFVVFCCNGSIDISEFLSALWTSFIAFFGGKPTGKSF